MTLFKSVGNIKQITRAMQLVATSKMKRAQKKAIDTDPFAYGALEILENLTRVFQNTKEYPYWENRKGVKVGLILITSDRGFCGGLNVLLLNNVLRFIREQEALGYTVSAVTIGKKGRNFMRRIGKTLDADFSVGDHFAAHQVGPIRQNVIKNFAQSLYKSVYIAYNQFVNTLIQKPIIQQILPFTIEIFKKIAEIDVKAKKNFLPDSSELFLLFCRP
jgi:F-type H+-transporting ATPase subunit gamma